MKKNPLIDLKKKRVAFLWIGRTVALCFVAIAFEFATFTTSKDTEWILDLEYETELLIPPTKEKIKPPPPPPKQITVIEVVDNSKDDLKDIVFDIPELIEDEPIEEIPFTEEEIVEAPIPLVKAEKAPSFPGGDKELFKFLGSQLKYPKMAIDSGIKGRVSLSFIVEKDGSITNIKIIRGIGGGCDEEAVRVLKSMPNWSPGLQRGKPVRVQFTLPVSFVLK